MGTYYFHACRAQVKKAWPSGKGAGLEIRKAELFFSPYHDT